MLLYAHKILRGAIRRHTWEGTFAPLLAIVNAALPAVSETVDVLTAITAERFQEYYAELLGIVETFNDLGYNETAGVSVKAMVAWNWMSELQHVNLTGTEERVDLFGLRSCTSLIARAADGTVLHARNDDASAHHYTTNLTVDLFIIRSNTTGEGYSLVAKSTHFLGWVGTYTSLRPGVASLTEDQRISPTFSQADYVALLQAQPFAGPTAFVMRQAMVDWGGGFYDSAAPVPWSQVTGERTFHSILRYLQTAPLGGPAYFILAGKNSTSNDEGAVLARNFTAGTPEHVSNRTWRLGTATAYVPFTWALIQTNYDFWEPLPYPEVDPRRLVLVDRFASLGQSVIATEDGLLASLSLPSNKSGVNGVLNVATIFTVIMIPANTTHVAYLRHGTGCCG